MAVCLIVNVPGATVEQYDQIREGVGDPLGEGQISHVAGEVDGGMCVVDVWESREAFDRFMQEHLGEQFARVGFSGQPEITEFQVHSSESRG
jgi:hypothetical protein